MVHVGSEVREDRGRFSHLHEGNCVGVFHPCKGGNAIYFVFEKICQYLLGYLKLIMT